MRVLMEEFPCQAVIGWIPILKYLLSGARGGPSLEPGVVGPYLVRGIGFPSRLPVDSTRSCLDLLGCNRWPIVPGVQYPDNAHCLLNHHHDLRGITVALERTHQDVDDLTLDVVEDTEGSLHNIVEDKVPLILRRNGGFSYPWSQGFCSYMDSRSYDFFGLETVK
jgi:hypothetical protein